MNEELKQAYAILGLPEDATREQVENRYFLLLKKQRPQQTRTNDATNSVVSELSEINRAYNLIIGIDMESISTEPKQGKVAHFFYYYKVHVIVSIIAILVIGITSKEIIDRKIAESKLPPIDISVTMYGNYPYADEELLQSNLLQLLPEWQRIKTTVVHAPKEIASEFDIALQQKAMLALATDFDQLYFLDERNIALLVGQGGFMRLDELPEWSEWQQKVNPSQIVMLSPEAEAYKNAINLGNVEAPKEIVEYPFGIDVTNHPAFANIEKTGERVIMAVRLVDDYWPKTQQLINQMLQ